MSIIIYSFFLFLSLLIYSLSIILNWSMTLKTTVVLISIVIILLFLLEYIYIPKYKQKHWRYDVDERCIQLKYGGIIRKNHKVIPMTKVYYVNTVQHFILRRFNLTTVKIGTLANTHEIPAIDSKEAEKIKELIVHLSKKN